MSHIFSYYDDWRSAQLECRKCHWKGRFDEGNIEYFRELMDCSCPLCSFDDTPVLAIVNYPTIEEMRASGDEIDRISEVEAFQRTFHSTKLCRPEQLPDADAASFKLFWDFIESDGSSVTVIRLGERVIFQEPALWEGYERFEEVCEILREKYGGCITDLEPTSASELYLYGDSISSPDHVRAVRKRVSIR